MSNIQKRLGEKVRELRKAKHLSQEKLAAHAGLHRTYISDIERGVRNVSIQNIEHLARALGVAPKTLLE